MGADHSMYGRPAKGGMANGSGAARSDGAASGDSGGGGATQEPEARDNDRGLDGGARDDRRDEGGDDAKGDGGGICAMGACRAARRRDSNGRGASRYDSRESGDGSATAGRRRAREWGWSGGHVSAPLAARAGTFRNARSLYEVPWVLRAAVLDRGVLPSGGLYLILSYLICLSIVQEWGARCCGVSICRRE